MGIIYFTQKANPYIGIQEGIANIHENEKPVPPDCKILLMIDLLISEGFPTSINPATLFSIIDYLKSFPNPTITILPNAYWNSDPQKVIDLLGFTDIFSAKNCQMADFKAYQSQPSQYLSQFSYTIYFSQVRIDPMLTVWSSFCSLAFFNPKFWSTFSTQENMQTYQLIEELITDENFFSIWYQTAAEVLSWKTPEIIIEDAYEFAEGNGPFIYSDSKIKKTQFQIISSDIYSSNAAICTLFGIEPKIHPILKFNDHFALKLESKANLTQINKEILKSIPYKKPPNDILKFSIPGLQLHIGEIGEGMKYNLIQLLSTLKSVGIKDTLQMGNWVLMAGKNPPEPPEKTPIILLGNDAIQTTENYTFRRMIEKKKVLPETEIDNKIFRNDSNLRDKIRQLEAHYENIKVEIAQKQNTLEREEATIKANKKLELTVLKMRSKNRKNDLKIRFQNQKANLFNETPKIILNKKILEISGNLPLAMDCLQYLVQNWPTTDIPGLILYWKGTKAFYQYPSFELKEFQTRMKKLQQLLTKDLKIKYEPIKKEVKIKLKELETQYKKDMKSESENYSKSKAEITEKYRPQELDLKTRQKAQLKANIQEKKAQLQEKIAKKSKKIENEKEIPLQTQDPSSLNEVEVNENKPNSNDELNPEAQKDE